MKFSFINRLRNKIRVASDTQVKLGRQIKIVNCSFFIKGKNNRLTVDDGVKLRGCVLEIVGNNCSLHIGMNCQIGNHCYLSVKEENINLTIGKNSVFSRNAKIMTSDGHPIFRNKQRINLAQDICIGDDVWLADNVTILKGVTVGNGSVIGINSLVTQNIPQSVVAVGSPCRIVKDGITWQE